MNKTPRMLAVEREFGGDIADIIRDFREIGGGNSWATVAGILGVGRVTLLNWRHRLGLPVEHEVQYDPLSFPHGHKTNSLDHKAIERGYASGSDWVLHLRLREGLSRAEAAGVLGVHPVTVDKYTPSAMAYRLEQWR